MPVEFRLEPTGSSSDTARLSMMYDGLGRRISKTFLTKSATTANWDSVKVMHYTGIGTEIREYKTWNFVRFLHFWHLIQK